MPLPEELAEGALHRLVLFHAAAGRAGTGEGPCVPRPALPGTPLRTVSPGTLPAHVRRCPPRPRPGNCALPGQVRGCGWDPAPPHGRHRHRHRSGRPAAQLPGPHSFPPPSTTGHCWHGPVGWGLGPPTPCPGEESPPPPSSLPASPPPASEGAGSSLLLRAVHGQVRWTLRKQLLCPAGGTSLANASVSTHPMGPHSCGAPGFLPCVEGRPIGKKKLAKQ